jgi:hypothetical protein
LIENKDELLQINPKSSNDLFSEEEEKTSTNVYFMPELKKVNYFLKIESASLELEDIMSKLNTITQISTAYWVDSDKLKSKNNLIF